MSFAESDPDNLLDSIKPHLDNNGGIKENSIPELLKLMSESQDSLVPKCISVCIIGASEATVQLRFIDTEGWDIMLKWLQKSIQQDDFSFLYELLGVYNQLPINMNHLTKNVCPKLINSISRKCTDQKSKDLAGVIVKKWKQLINSEPKKPLADLQPQKRKKEEVVLPEVKDKKRRSTVKMPPTIMRTAGIEEETIKTPRTRVDTPKKPVAKVEEMNNMTTDTLESLHSKINLVSNESKKVERQESADFINALTTTSSNNLIRKKKKIIKHSLGSNSEGNEETSSLSNGLNNGYGESAFETEINLSCNESNDLIAPDENSNQEGKIKSSLADFESVFSTDEKDRKSVTWAPEEDLVAVRYFELDENERVNVNKLTHDDLRRKEMNMDRQGFNKGDEILDTQWNMPYEVDLTPVIEVGNKSEERKIQMERERYVLQVLYFTKDSIPPQPAEPDPQEYDSSVPVDIPLDDSVVDHQANDMDAFNSKNSLLIKDSEQGDKVVLNPMLADLVKSLAETCKNGNNNNNNLNNAGNGGYSIKDSFDNNKIVNENSDKIINSDDNLSSNISNLRTRKAGSYYDSESDQPHNDMQFKIWEILEKNYPEYQVRELSEERISELLKPLKDQLIEKGIVPPPPSGGYHSMDNHFGYGHRPPMPHRMPARPPPPHDRYGHAYHPYPMPPRMGPNGPMYPPRPRPGMIPRYRQQMLRNRIDGPRGRVKR